MCIFGPASPYSLLDVFRAALRQTNSELRSMVSDGLQ